MRSLPLWAFQRGKITMLRLILSLLKPAGRRNLICAGNDKDNKMVMSPSTRKLFYLCTSGATPCSPVPLPQYLVPATDEEIVVH